MPNNPARVGIILAADVLQSSYQKCKELPYTTFGFLSGALHKVAALEMASKAAKT
jgi:hypothetical protein